LSKPGEQEVLIFNTSVFTKSIFFGTRGRLRLKIFLKKGLTSWKAVCYDDDLPQKTVINRERFQKVKRLMEETAIK